MLRSVGAFSLTKRPLFRAWSTQTPIMRRPPRVTSGEVAPRFPQLLSKYARLIPKLLKVKGIGRRGFNRSAHAVDAQRYGIAQDEIDSLPRRLLAAPPTQRAESHDDDRRSERRASVTTK